MSSQGDFAERIYSRTRGRRTALQTFADRVYGRPQGPEYRSSSDRWDYWLDRLRANVANDLDNFVSINGRPGCGKSTLAWKIGRGLHPEIDETNLEEHVAFSITQFHELILKSEETYLQLDEAAVGGGALDWNSPEAKALVETAQTMRYRHLTVALLIPNASDLMLALRQRRAEFHLACSNDPKGAATVREKNWDLERPLKGGDLGLRTPWEWNPLTWEPFRKKDPFWRRYLELKKQADERRARRHLITLQAREAVGATQAAKALGVTDDTIRNWIRDGILRADRTPTGKNRIPLSEIERLRSGT